MSNKLNTSFESVRKKTDFIPKVAVVLGSGLGNLGDKVSPESIVPYSTIDGFPVSTAPGHKGRFVFCYINNVATVLMQGRVHYYEGYSMEEVILPIRLMHLLGANVLFLTNAAGGINTGFHPGSFMLIEDQISSFAPSPLVGSNNDSLGVRFPDMSEIYNADLRQQIIKTAQEKNIKLERGTYLQMTGPQYESPAEIKMCRVLGADAVGMSTCCEAIAARHIGMRVCGISCISNLAAGMGNHLLSAEDVNETAERVGETFETLVTETIGSFQMNGLL